MSAVVNNCCVGTYICIVLEVICVGETVVMRLLSGATHRLIVIKDSRDAKLNTMDPLRIYEYL